MEEFKNNLEKKLSSFEEDVMSKKQRKFIRDFKDYQSCRILTFHRKYDHMVMENEKEPVIANNNKDFTSEVEESNVLDGTQTDVSDSHLEKGAVVDKNLNKSNFFKQFRLLNQGRTDQRKEVFPQRGRGRDTRGRGRGTGQQRYEQGKEDSGKLV
ncbi:hypothetical protein NDU88_001846 [Pleurodeles waltl]|uniref:Uncharacterized protein n=1 Tax=Pleurodeles waltl TaxID=8319 RepID=A0AAV7KRZ2_PLEWA|nr:hypothetical protein NDU88_001846 [Pleurodeles waltl]